MNRNGWIVGATAALALIGLTGCAPTLAGANAAGGMIHMNGDKSGSFKMADQECHKHGKKARVSKVSELDDTFTYDCVD